jgi:DNA-binding NarL/FixJ family response regulator
MIQIALVDDHAIIRAGLRHVLSKEVDFRVMAEAENGHEAQRLASRDDIDVVVLDLSIQDYCGVDVLRALRLRRPRLPVLMVGQTPETHCAITLLRLGASGYLSLGCEAPEIARAIRTVHRGRRYVTPVLAELLAGRASGDAPCPPHDQLSDREFHVFLQLARGTTIGRLALHLALSVKTVSTYRARVMDKLGLSSNSELTYYALKNGLMQ